jgi:glycosyltransferase involved in cell wall biosynthesis
LSVHITAVLPVYNDREALKTAIPESLKILEATGKSFELLIAEDASRDGSRECAAEWERNDPRVRLLHSDERQGRGRALAAAFAESEGEIFCYYDVDLATDISHIPELIIRIENGADAATGSRLMPDSKIIRSSGRDIASRGYNALVRLFLGSRLCDHQCGFKAYKRSSLQKLIPKIRAPHWFWDTESLVLAQRAGFRVDEFPVVWTQGPGTTVKFRDVTGMGADILKMWWRLHVEKS